MSRPLRKQQDPVTVDEITLQNQRRASAPDSSAWVAANAGSGKTFVLTQRVKRLLLAGVRPEKILCLTYTKAAAANMANRILSDLAAWVNLPEPELRKVIADLDGRTVQQIKETELRRARQLFALALETPGGLKIQTIHAFCDALLHQFPFEAGIAGQFQILDDLSRDAMIAEAFERLLRSNQEATKLAVRKLLLGYAPEKLKELITKNYSRLVAVEGNFKSCIYAAFNLDEAINEASILNEIITGAAITQAQWPQLLAAFESAIDRGNKKDKSTRNAFTMKRACAASLQNCARAYLDLFLSGDGDLYTKSYFPGAKFRETYPEYAAKLYDELERLVPFNDMLRRLDAAENALAFLKVADGVCNEVERQKAAQGLLDFADIISRADTLLNSDAAPWVRYKLDQGVDHVLVDEAQDTSEAQWSVIRGLTQEFFVGQGPRDVLRTIFAVGDDKQSIFSFQGAKRELFEIERERVASASRDVGLSFSSVSLNLSFRSSPVILKAVDAVFSNALAALEVTGEETFPPHEAAKQKLPGQVEIWPLELPAEKSSVDAFDHPFLSAESQHPRARLATKIAAHIASDVKAGKVQAGDVIILVRTRNALFENLIRELKSQGLPVAGADRLILNEHIAAVDLLALGQAVLLPEDDLTFAALLKSPLFGLEDDDLFALAYDRPASLIESLKRRAPEKPLWNQAYEQFLLWQTRAQQCRPYEFYARILGEDGMRRAFLARLGSEANEILDEFLNATLAFESNATPTLQNFLKFMSETRAEIKREMQQGQNEVRVMTVHNAKGLEAKWIVLADTVDQPGKAQLGDFYEIETEQGRALTWATGEKNRIGAIDAAKNAAEALQLGEYRRLFYVALTRAEQRLTICGASLKKEIPEDSWYGFAQTALLPLCVEEKDAQGRVWRWIMKSGDLAQVPQSDQNDDKVLLSRLLWFDKRTSFVPPPLILNPSKADTAHVENTGVLAPEIARARGTLLHRLLEHLPRYPQESHRARAQYFLDRRAPAFSVAQKKELIDEALAVLALPQAEEIFGSDALTELWINADIVLPNGKPAIVQGQVDRMILRPDTLHIIDYKSGFAPQPSLVPQAYLAQLALYREALKTLVEKRIIKCYLLWTSVPRLDEIGVPALAQAFAKLA